MIVILGLSGVMKSHFCLLQLSISQYVVSLIRSAVEVLKIRNVQLFYLLKFSNQQHDVP